MTAPHTPESLLRGNPYPGRGILLGLTPDGRQAAAAYFIMGRSENSRNRIFEEKGSEVFTAPFDASRVQDPSLIIYAAIRTQGNRLIVTNGDQTDTIHDGLAAGKSFADSLSARIFEPDAPNFTPRISGLYTLFPDAPRYELSILKSASAEGTACNRFFFTYAPLPGLGHLLHTYQGDGSPLPSFEGEPRPVAVPASARELATRLWNALDPDNRISLYVRYVTLADGSTENILLNKYPEA